MADIRRDYTNIALNPESMDQDPLKQFDKWLEQAIESNMPEPTAMSIASVGQNGQPSSRMVLLKGIRGDKMLFYTNYNSRKSREFFSNPKCAATFYWPNLERQVNLLGTVKKTDEKTSDKYFRSRPWKSQVGAWASPQSEPIRSRNEIMLNFAKYSARFFGRKVPRPPHWGGYEITPHEISFWQGRPNRLHDRIKYTKTDSGVWKIERIAP